MSTRPPAPFLRAVWAIAAKDLRIEARAKEVVSAMVLFAALLVLLFAFAFTREGQSDRLAAGGVVWIAIALAGTLGLNRSMDRERESAAMRALLLAPIDRGALYLGKLVGISAFILVAEVACVPLAALLFQAPLLSQIVPLATLLVLGTVGFAAVGSLFAAMLLRARGRDVLLGILLYPLVVPLLLAGTRGTQALLDLPADPPAAWFWARLMLAFDAVFVVVGLWLYEPLVTGE